jgi:hypothetical protein
MGCRVCVHQRADGGGHGGGRHTRHPAVLGGADQVDGARPGDACLFAPPPHPLVQPGRGRLRRQEVDLRRMEGCAA